MLATALALLHAGPAAAPLPSQGVAQVTADRARLFAEAAVADLYPPGPGGLAAGAVRDLIIAEGDSWFSYPGLDVLTALEQGIGGTRYGVFSAAKAGDTVEAMAYDGEQVKGFLREFKKVKDMNRAADVRAILLSGGGNDIAGREFHLLLNHAKSIAASTRGALDETLTDAFIERLGRNLEFLICTAAAFASTMLNRTDIPILIHGYAPPVPDGRPFLIGWPLPGPWLQPGFSSKGFGVEQAAELERNTAVMALLIEKFNRRAAQIEVNLKDVAKVRYVNVTGITSNVVTDARYKHDWSNELHPRESAFRKVAEAFHRRIQEQ